MKTISPDPSMDNKHVVGNAKCQEGWCGTDGYPALCDCGGIIHADFGDESEDGVSVITLCDKCGERV